MNQNNEMWNDTIECFSKQEFLSEEDRIEYILSRNYISEEFIRKHKDKVNWYTVCQCQKLSEDFIREFQDKVLWSWISRTQDLSEKFIREFQHKVNWSSIASNQEISEEFMREFKDNIEKSTGRTIEFIIERR